MAISVLTMWYVNHFQSDVPLSGARGKVAKSTSLYLAIFWEIFRTEDQNGTKFALTKVQDSRNEISMLISLCVNNTVHYTDIHIKSEGLKNK